MLKPNLTCEFVGCTAPTTVLFPSLLPDVYPEPVAHCAEHAWAASSDENYCRHVQLDREAAEFVPAPTGRSVHFHAGRNLPGYLPDSEPETFATFGDAADWLVTELSWSADNVETWAEPHDCDDIPCPTFGDDCPWSLAQGLRLAAEELAFETGPEWETHVRDGYSSAATVWWVMPCAEGDCEPEPDEDNVEDEDDEPGALDETSARRLASEWYGPDAPDLTSFATTGDRLPGLWVEVEREVEDEGDRARLLAYLGDEPDLDDEDDVEDDDEPDFEPDGWACADCIVFVANGETPVDLDEDETAAWLDNFERRNTGHHVVASDGERTFSGSPCHVCGSRLAGSRHGVALLPAEPVPAAPIEPAPAPSLRMHLHVEASDEYLGRIDVHDEGQARARASEQAVAVGRSIRATVETAHGDVIDRFVVPAEPEPGPKLVCRFPHAPHCWCGPFCERSAPDGTFETREERDRRLSPADFVDVVYGDVVAGDHVYDRTVSRFVRVTGVAERNATDVELNLWGGSALVAPTDTPIARRPRPCPTCGDTAQWCKGAEEPGGPRCA